MKKNKPDQNKNKNSSKVDLEKTIHNDNLDSKNEDKNKNLSDKELLIEKLKQKIKELKEQNVHLNSEISSLKRQINVYKASHEVVENLRDTQSFLEKQKKEWEEKKKYAAKSFVFSIIEPLEWFEQSLKSSNNPNISNEIRNWLKGFDIILNKFKNIILKEGVEEIKTQVGDLFDEKIHNAIETVSDKNFKPNTIVEIFQKGYKFHDIVIKHVQVKVAK
ncbi:nucleotide exchange factor GrpE [symbiont of Argiope bruennichi]|uniref:nucleotide exchange factor GrpE n=1 Tax=symbiont of Argiope bruennichi TaxID=2810479 RepID=UPI003DA40D97